MSEDETIGPERLVITLTPSGKFAVICDHCGMDELIPAESIGSFVRGRVAAHVGLMATVATMRKAGTL